MNSNSLHYSKPIEVSALPHRGIADAIISNLSAWIKRLATRQAQARYRARLERRAQTGQQRPLLDSLPLEKKHALGMYRFMD